MRNSGASLTASIAETGQGVLDPRRVSGAARPGIEAYDGRSTIRFLTAQIIVLIYLQKLSFPFSPIWAPMVFCFAMLLPALKAGALGVNRSRLAIYSIFAALAIASQVTVEKFAWTSMLLVLVLNSVLTFEWRLSSRDYAKLCRNFSTCMILPAVFVFIQYVYEVTHGIGSSLSLDSYLPKAFLTEGFISESSTDGWVTWNRPNGLVFLEPSYCSAFLAAATIVEFHVLRRWFMAAFFLAAIVTANGGTGLLMLLIALIVIGFNRRPLDTMLVVIVAMVALAVLGLTSMELPLVSRLSELNNADSSGYGRILAPLEGLRDLASRPEFFFSGRGAGQITEDDYGSAWPLTKLVFEYGTATAAAYFLLVCNWIKWRSNLPLGIALFVTYQFTGGYLVNPFLILLIHCLCAGQVFDLPANPVAPYIDETE